ncbi:DUF3603 family protein [Bacillus sp. T33-2]|uniref:DUF3603 family protein n=1 Tax=Bacillus sp. T33-2 TaxID=2054168 RepID=UPI000C774519|nr:DUF3603 family protein [Bacillus sp. T33-2]PLR99546.1 DUF3603 domain-containing protein [Bacillus sp. T33-2]
MAQLKFMSDVWVNWFEGQENGYNVFDYHEWRKDEDVIALLDQVPLLKVDSNLYDYVENDLREIPRGLLEAIHKKAYLRKNGTRMQLEYAFVLTDGNGILAVDTISTGIPIRKSRLIPRQEQLVYELTDNQQIDFKLPKELKKEKEFNMLSPHPHIMAGLTRRERTLKQMLFMGLDDAYNDNNIGKIKYLYTEFNNDFNDVKDMDLESVYKLLVKEVSQGWGEKHESVCKVLTYGNPFLAKIYESETVKTTKINKGGK